LNDGHCCHCHYTIDWEVPHVIQVSSYAFSNGKRYRPSHLPIIRQSLPQDLKWVCQIRETNKMCSEWTGLGTTALHYSKSSKFWLRASQRVYTRWRDKIKNNPFKPVIMSTVVVYEHLFQTYSTFALLTTTIQMYSELSLMPSV